MPVIYSPSGEVIGQAATRRGAIRCARNIRKLPCEQWTANTGEVIDRPDMADFTRVWRVGVVLARSAT
jgi:hypothetical protein